MSIRPCLSAPCSSLMAATAFRWEAVRQSTRRFSRSAARSENKDEQPQTPATEKIELTEPVVYISESHDPWFNLSYEDWLLRNTPSNQPTLFLYRNIPCVVVGRNQNPWKESTPKYLRSISLPLVRRRSGGGTVYHDMGNTNFSVMLPRLMFTRNHGAELVAKAIRERLGVKECTVNDRNDVIIRDGSKDFKVSGSAYKIIQHRAYHHGTMLISSSVAELGKALRSNSPNMETKGIASFRSPVTTLNAYLPPTRSKALTHSDFVAALTKEFASVYASSGKKLETREVTEGGVIEPKVWKGVEEMLSWEWTYGQTPEFTNSFEGEMSVGNIAVSLSSRHALITSLSFHLTPNKGLTDAAARETQTFLDALALSLVGKRYETLEGAEGASGPDFDDPQYRQLAGEIVAWLRQHM